MILFGRTIAEDICETIEALESDAQFQADSVLDGVEPEAALAAATSAVAAASAVEMKLQQTELKLQRSEELNVSLMSRNTSLEAELVAAIAAAAAEREKAAAAMVRSRDRAAATTTTAVATSVPQKKKTPNSPSRQINLVAMESENIKLLNRCNELSRKNKDFASDSTFYIAEINYISEENNLLKQQHNK